VAITRSDRLARSTHDLLNTLAQIADKGAGFRLVPTMASPRCEQGFRLARLTGRASSRSARTFRHSLDGPDERLFGRVASKDGFKDIDQNRGKRR
jgi:hypothetical protein